MNLIIYKSCTRFSIVKPVSNNCGANLIKSYLATEKSFFSHCVKTKQDFVSFTFKLSNYITITNADFSFSNKFDEKPLNGFALDLITNAQLFASIFSDKQKLSYKTEKNLFTYVNRFTKINSQSIVYAVISKNKVNYITTLFFYIRYGFSRNYSSADKYTHPFFNNTFYSIDFAKTTPYAQPNSGLKAHLFNSFSVNSNFGYIYYAYSLKKNTRETVGFFNNPSFFKGSSNVYDICLATTINQSFFPKKIDKKTTSHMVPHINEYIQYSPRKKRKIVVKRKHWKRGVAFAKFFNKNKKSINKQKNGLDRASWSRKESIFKRVKKTKKGFFIARILYNYLFVENFGQAKKIHSFSNINKRVRRTKNKYLYSFSNGIKINTFWKNVSTLKKAKIKTKRFAASKNNLYTKNPSRFNYIIKGSKKSKKTFLHNNRRVQFTNSTHTLQKTVPSVQFRFLEDFMRRTFGTKISLFRINAFSFTRYSFNNSLKEKEFERNKKKKRAANFGWADYRALLNGKKAKTVRGINLAKRKKTIEYIDQNDMYNQMYNTQKYTELNYIEDKTASFTKGLPKIFLTAKQNAKGKQKFKFNNKFIRKKTVKNSNLFIKALEKERTLRYRYTAVYIKDLLRLTFVGFYYKHAQLIREFAAFILKKLPRNRKETKFLRFIMKMRKVFAAQREEVVGIRLRFQGRVNRWRRTKHIMGRKGMFPLHTFDTYVTYGRAQAITRKGAFGRRLWIAYHSFFGKTYRTNFFTYLSSSKAIGSLISLN